MDDLVSIMEYLDFGTNSQRLFFTTFDIRYIYSLHYNFMCNINYRLHIIFPDGESIKDTKYIRIFLYSKDIIIITYNNIKNGQHIEIFSFFVNCEDFLLYLQELLKLKRKNIINEILN